MLAGANGADADEAAQQPLNRVVAPEATTGDSEAAENRTDGEALAPPESEEAEFARLAALSDLEYEKNRKPKAKELGFRVSVLDRKVTEAREMAKAAATESADADVEEHRAGFTITSGAPVGAEPERARKPNANGVIFPANFAMKETGLWYQTADGEPPEVWIAAPFQIVAGTNDDADQSFGLLLRWIDCNGHEHEWAMPKRMVHAEGDAIASELEDAGLSCGTSRKAHEGLKHFLGAVRPSHRVRCVERARSHGNIYVLPNGRVFGAG